MNPTPTQQKVLDVVQEKVKASCFAVSQALNMNPRTAGLHLRRLEEMGFVHVAEHDTSKPRMPINIYACGAGYKTKTKKSKNKHDVPKITVVVPRPDIAAAWLMT